jgi:colicin import membrane protein
MAEKNEKAQAEAQAKAAAEKTEKDKAQQAEANRADPSAEVQAAEEAEMTEGEVKALRADAGLDQLAGHEANVHAWEQSEAGQRFLEGEDDRLKQYEEEEKAYAEQTDDDGLNEAEARYFEAVNKARGQ